MHVPWTLTSLGSCTAASCKLLMEVKGRACTGQSSSHRSRQAAAQSAQSSRAHAVQLEQHCAHAAFSLAAHLVQDVLRLVCGSNPQPHHRLLIKLDLLAWAPQKQVGRLGRALGQLQDVHLEHAQLLGAIAISGHQLSSAAAQPGPQLADSLLAVIHVRLGQLALELQKPSVLASAAVPLSLPDLTALWCVMA